MLIMYNIIIKCLLLYKCSLLDNIFSVNKLLVELTKIKGPQKK